MVEDVTYKFKAFEEAEAAFTGASWLHDVAGLQDQEVMKQSKAMHQEAELDNLTRMKSQELTQLNIMIIQAETTTDTRAAVILRQAYNNLLSATTVEGIQAALQEANMDSLRTGGGVDGAPETPQTPEQKYISALKAEMQHNENMDRIFDKLEAAGIKFDPKEKERRKEIKDKEKELEKLIESDPNNKALRQQWDTLEEENRKIKQNMIEEAKTQAPNNPAAQKIIRNELDPETANGNKLSENTTKIEADLDKKIAQENSRSASTESVQNSSISPQTDIAASTSSLSTASTQDVAASLREKLAKIKSSQQEQSSDSEIISSEASLGTLSPTGTKIVQVSNVKTSISIS